MTRAIHRTGIAAMVLALIALFAAGEAQAAVSVVLECVYDNQSANMPNTHNLYEIDYDASTVRVHSVDDDGSPLSVNGQPTADLTYPAEISDSEIKWTEQYMAGPSYETLGRYSGKLTSEGHYSGFTDGQIHVMTNYRACHPYTPPQNGQRQF